MTESPARAIMVRRLLAVAEGDPRIVGVVDYGSSSEGRVDEWSDLDVALFIRDADFDRFRREWRDWATCLGPLLLAYVGGVGHPWTVYDATPVPLRVDFVLHRASAADEIATWPNSPTSAAAMVWYDGTGGAVTAAARRLVGKSLRPQDLAATFEQVCGDFWYYFLRTYSKFRRGQLWAVRFDYNLMVLGNLLALLRLEADATERWQASSAATDIERVLRPARLAELNACIPGADPSGLGAALGAAAILGREVCAAVAAKHQQGWPQALADRCVTLARGELLRGPRR